MKDIVFEIEERFPEAHEIKINGLQIWPFVRIMFRYMIVEKKMKSAYDANLKKKSSPTLVTRVKRRILPNLTKWFKRYDVIIFSNESEKKLFEGKYVDKLSEGIVELLKPGKSLTINYFSGDPISHQLLNNAEYSVDGLVISRVVRLVMKFTKVVVSEENKEILKRILDAYQLSWIDLESRIRVMLAQAFVTNKYLKFFKPKFVITSCYSNFSEVLASRQNNIQTIELQHGIISRLHPGYESLFKLNKDFTADHLLVFGDNSIKELDDNIVNRDKSFVVGNYYLDVLKTTPKNQAILEMISGYALSVSVPTDFLTENGILDFILEVAGKRPDILFLIVPRTSITDKGTALVANFKNIKVVSQHSFQDVVRHTTFHTATNSTCCLEALFFGIPNLLIDREGGVKELYGSLTDVRFTKFLSSPEEYIETITHWKHADCSEISESNRNNFAVDYKSNLINAFRKIGVI